MKNCNCYNLENTDAPNMSNHELGCWIQNIADENAFDQHRVGPLDRIALVEAARRLMEYNTPMSKQQMIDFLVSLTEDQVFAILESARVSLADAEIAFDVGLKVKMSDADINNLQNKIHEHMA
jgi:hypothetical protein